MERKLLAIFDNPLPEDAVKVETEQPIFDSAQQEAIDFVRKFVDEKLGEINKVRGDNGQSLIQSWPKPNLLQSSKFADDSATIKIVPNGTSYGHFVVLGSDKEIKVAYDVYREQVTHALSFEEFVSLVRPLPPAVCAVVQTSDDKIIFVKRGMNVGTYQGSYHVIGGYMENSHPNPFDAIKGEIKEEVPGMQNEGAEVVDLKLLGVDLDRNRIHPEFLFLAKVNLTSDQIKASEADDSDGKTMVRPYKNRFYFEALEKAENNGKVVPTGASNLWLASHWLRGDWHPEELRRQTAPFTF